MRITILANRDLASNLAINQLISALPEHRFRILLSEKVGASGPRPAAMEELAFFEQQLFNELLFPALDNAPVPAAGVPLTFHAMQAKGIQVDAVGEINDGRGYTLLKESQPDVILSVRFGRILKTPALQVPTIGVLNLHSGLLPAYRGIMATFWSMLHGQEQIGSTLHWIMDAGIDTGDIVAVNPVKTDYARSYLCNLLNLYPPGIDSMIEAVRTLDAGNDLNASPQAQAGAAYYGLPDEASLAAFSQKGLRLLDRQALLTQARNYIQSSE